MATYDQATGRWLDENNQQPIWNFPTPNLAAQNAGNTDQGLAANRSFADQGFAGVGTPPANNPTVRNDAGPGMQIRTMYGQTTPPPGQPGGAPAPNPTTRTPYNTTPGSNVFGNAPTNTGFQFDPSNFGSAGRFQIDPQLESAFRFALQQAQQRYMDPNATKYYGGSTVAGLTPDEIAAQGMARGAAGNMQPMIDSVGQYYQSLLGQPGQANPAMEAAIAAMRKNAITSFNDPGGPMQQIRDSSMGAGQYGGTRQALSEGIAMGRLGDSLVSNEANMRYSDLKDQYARASGAASALPSYLSSTLMPATTYGGVGAQNRSVDQARLDADFQKWAYEQTAPDTQLQNYLNSVNGSMPIGGTNYSQQFMPSWYTDAMKATSGASGGSGNNILAAIAAAGGLWKLFGN